MSKKSIKIANRIYKGIMISIAVVIAVMALRMNPGHLFTAGLVFAFALESELVSKDAADIC